MDQNKRFKGSIFSSLVLICSAILAFVLGLSMLFGKPGEIWWIGLVLIFFGLLVGISAISIYHSTEKEKKIADEMATINTYNNTQTDKLKVQMLANWLYSITEWKEFMKWERKKSYSNILSETTVLMALTLLGIHYLKNAEWDTSIIISIVVGIGYIFIKYFIAISSIRLEDNKMPEVIITNQAIIVNGHMNRFYGNKLWLGKVTVNDAGSFNVLEITYCWHTTNGQTYDEIRVPIPKGNLKEAIFLQEKLMSEKRLTEQAY